MRLATRREMERGLGSLTLALLFHLLIYLLIEYGGVILPEKEAGYIGPVLVQLTDVTSIPRTAKVKGEEPALKEQPALEPKETVKSEQPSTMESKTQPAKGPEVVGDKGASDLSAVKTEKPVPERVLEAKGSTSEGSPPVKTAPVVADQSFYEEKSQGLELTIKMGNTSDKAKPMFRPALRSSLPDWVIRQEVKAVVIVSFLVGSDGYITNLNIDKSSGYTDIDQAVVQSMRVWKFSNPTGRENVPGTTTIRTNQK